MMAARSPRPTTAARLSAMRPTLWAAGATSCAAVVLLLLAGFSKPLRIESLSRFPRTVLAVYVRGRVVRFKVWVADTQARQDQGLMFVRDLPADQGMLFPESPPRMAKMWMLNTYIPLDMLFIGTSGRIEQVIANATPFSLKVLRSHAPVAAVIEIPGGEARRLHIGPGDRVQWGGWPGNEAP